LTSVKLDKYLEDGKKLEIRLAGDDGKYYKSQVLQVREKFFLITPPYRGKDNLFLHRNEEVEVILYGTNEKFIFTTTVIKKVNEPLSGYVLVTPEEGKRIQLREHVRVKTFLDVEWALPEEDSLEKGIMVDISGGGAGIVTGKPVEEDALILLRFELPLKNRPLQMSVKAVVRRCQPMPEHGKYLLGVSFQEITERDRDQVIEYVFQKQREQRLLDLGD